MTVKTAQRESAIRRLIHSPPDLVVGLSDWHENVLSVQTGPTFGIPVVDKSVIPMKPGELITIIGRPGDGKTSLGAALAMQEAKRIRERGTADKEAVVYVTWEASAEELAAMLLTTTGVSYTDLVWGRVPHDELLAKAKAQAQQPIWVIGLGISRSLQATSGQRIRMTPPVVYEALEMMRHDHGIVPTLVIFDYIQIVPTTGRQSRVEQVGEIPPRLNELAKMHGTPAVALAQAKREVDDRKIKLAEMRDAMWASDIEHASAKIFSIWRPFRTENDGDSLDLAWGGSRVTVTERLFILRMHKQASCRPMGCCTHRPIPVRVTCRRNCPISTYWHQRHA